MVLILFIFIPEFHNFPGGEKKKSMKKNNKSRIIQIIYFALIIFVSILIGIFSIRFYINKRAENRDIMQSSFEYAYNASEEKIHALQNISRLLFESDITKDTVARKNSYDYLQVTKLIKSYKDAFGCVNNQIYLTDLNDDFCISESGTELLSSLENQLNIKQGKIKDIYRDFNTNDIKFSIDEKKHLIMLTFGYKYYGTADNLFCIVISDISNFIPETYNNSRIVLTTDSPDKENGEIFRQNSTYVKNLQYRYFNDSSNIAINIFMFLIAISCIILILSAKKLSFKMFEITYTPIIKMLKPLGYKEGSNEHPAVFIEQLIRNNRLQIQKMNEASLYVKKTYIKNLIFGITSQIPPAFNHYTVPFKNTPCRVILINGKSDSDGFFTDLETLMNKIFRGEFIYLNSSQNLFVSTDTDQDELSEKLVRVLDFADLSNTHIFISVGKTVNTLEDIQFSYKNACDNCEQIIDSSISRIVFSENITESNDEYYYPIDIELSLIENTVCGNSNKVSEILNELIETNFRTRMLNAENIRDFKIMLTGTINRILKQLNSAADEIFGDESAVYLEISALRNINETIQNIEKTFEKLCSHAQSSNTTRQEQLAGAILDYIRQNYKNPNLSLVMIAEHFLISQVHVRRMISYGSDKSYKEYLDTLRIEESKKLLVSTEKKVNTVAEEVGYSNTRTFIRVFEKYTGISPSEYRLRAKKFK